MMENHVGLAAEQSREARSSTAALIVRLEKATGSDPFLDELLEAERYGWTVLEIGEDKHTKFVWLRDADGIEFMHREFASGGYAADKYTASIDAALTLLPENHAWMIDDSSCADSAAAVWHGLSARPDHCERACTPAIALCIAALRARAEVEERE